MNKSLEVKSGTRVLSKYGDQNTLFVNKSGEQVFYRWVVNRSCEQELLTRVLKRVVNMRCSQELLTKVVTKTSF